jgi:hypothetical protein
VSLYPFEERLDLAQVIFGRDFPLKENVDRLLPDIKILYTLANQPLNVLESSARAKISFRDLLQRNLGLIGTW